MPQVDQPLLPGVKGKDYRYVKYGGRIYVVYDVKLPNGKTVRMSWRVDPEDYKALGVDPGKIESIGRAQHEQLAFFGDASEIVGGDPGEHPFEKYLRSLRELHGNVSWLGDKDFMGIMLMGYAESWSSAELQQRLSRTKWYESRTASERSWELDMSRADRKGAIDTWNQRLTTALEELYGPNFTLSEAGVDLKALRKRAEAIASGKWGDPSEGYEQWLAQERNKVEQIEGTAAWIENQQTIQDENAFLNAPEDMFESLRQDAMAWLGPSALPDTSVLRDWAERLVAGTASEADWATFIQGQASALYPFLGPNERWQDRASAYKRIAEEAWDMPIGWDNAILSQLGGTGTDGAPTGAAMTYDEYTKMVRSKPEFWQGPVAREQGFELFNLMNSVFNGVQS